MSTVKEYIEESLFIYSSIYDSKAAVLSHLFTSIGNGIDLDINGYLPINNHPSMIKNPEKFLWDKEVSLAKSIGIFQGTIQEQHKFLRNVKKGLMYKAAYLTEPNFITLYPTETLPFLKYKGCKCPDLNDHILYFIDFVNKMKESDITVENVYPFLSEKLIEVNGNVYQKELGIYKKSLKVWKRNIHRLKDIMN